MVKFGIVVNPVSRQNRKKGVVDRIIELAGDRHVISIAKNAEYMPLPEDYLLCLDKIIQENVDAVLIDSGDGGEGLWDTIKFKELNLEEMKPQVNIRGGTMNVRAEALGVPRLSPDKLVKLYLDTYEDKDISEFKIVNRNLLRINSPERKLIGFSYASGFVEKLFREYYRLGGSHWGAIKLIGQGLNELPDSKGLVDRCLDQLDVVAKVYYVDKQENLSFIRSSRSKENRVILAFSQDVSMDFRVAKLGAQEFLGTNEEFSFRYLSSKGLTKWDLFRQLFNVFNFYGEHSNLSIPDLVKIDALRLDILSNDEHKYIIDGDFYESKGDISIAPTKPVDYLVI